MARPSNRDRIVRLIRATGRPFLAEEYLPEDADDYAREVAARLTLTTGAIRDALGDSPGVGYDLLRMIEDGTLLLMLDDGNSDDAALGGCSPLHVAVNEERA